MNIGNKCIECKNDTSLGSGRFVNRIPASNENHDGYMCVDCQSIECDKCSEMTINFTFGNEDYWCLCDECEDELNFNNKG